MGKGVSGWHHSKETTMLLSKQRKGKTYEEMYGPEKALEKSQKHSKTMKGRTPWNKGRTGIYSEEHILKIAEANRRRVVTDETKLKQSESHKNLPKLTCPHCGKIGGWGGMKAWHFNNCKMKK